MNEKCVNCPFYYDCKKSDKTICLISLVKNKIIDKIEFLQEKEEKFNYYKFINGLTQDTMKMLLFEFKKPLRCQFCIEEEPCNNTKKEVCLEKINRWLISKPKKRK